MSPHTRPVLHVFELYFLHCDANMPHIGHWYENNKKDSLYFLRYGANPNDEKCPNSTGGATVG